MDAALEHILANRTELARNMHQTADTHKTVSLFSGCGGMDLGFLGGFNFMSRTYDALPFAIAWANDIDPAACRTYQHNFDHDIVCGDISTLSISDIPRADVVLGGFPCQDFSIAGKRRGFDSERGQLYRFMGDVIQHCKPKVFVAENVKGLLSIPHAIDRITQDFAHLGYHIDWRLLNAADYGVPQYRERVFIVGTKTKRQIDRFAWPEKAEKHITAHQALKDLESIGWNGANGHIWSKAKRTSGQGQKPIKNDAPSITIRAEHHGNIEYHYLLDRRLSVREAARLQSFPDTFSLISTQSAAYKQIGNAVPPVLAWNLARSIVDILQ